MKRTILICAGLALCLSVLWAGVLHAANMRSGDTPIIMNGETVNGTLYTAGRIVTVEGTVKGDLMCAGREVDITGTVEGDVLCAAQNITITGHVEGDIRTVAQTATLSGQTDGSVTVLAQSANLSGQIGRDLTITADNANVGGKVGRDEAAVANVFATTGMISRDLTVTGGSIALNGNATVGGDFGYTSRNDAQIAGSARVAGKTSHAVPKESSRVAVSPADMIAATAYIYFGFLLIGVAALLFTPRLVRVVSNAMDVSVWSTVGAGISGLIAPPLVALVLCFTLVGIPLAIVVLLMWVVSLIVGTAFTAAAIGRAISAKLQWNNTAGIASLIVGLLVLFLAALIPVIGGFISFAAMVWGVGGLWYVLFKYRRATPQPTVVIAEVEALPEPTTEPRKKVKKEEPKEGPKDKS